MVVALSALCGFFRGSRVLCGERTGTPEHFTASIVGHQSARSANKLTYGLYSAGISDEQKRQIVDKVRLPAEATP